MWNCYTVYLSRTSEDFMLQVLHQGTEGIQGQDNSAPVLGGLRECSKSNSWHRWKTTRAYLRLELLSLLEDFLRAFLSLSRDFLAAFSDPLDEADRLRLLLRTLQEFMDVKNMACITFLRHKGICYYLWGVRYSMVVQYNMVGNIFLKFTLD